MLCPSPQIWVSVHYTSGAVALLPVPAGYKKSPKQGLYNVIVGNGDISCYPLSWMTLIF